ncbi:MAG: hypothetical protein JXQ67_11380 [Campylobacterales bacterium]|nr:hypothetical protein [Campylobacterales bacterium]
MQSKLEQLQKQYEALDKIILSRQDAITGLLPASTAVNAHGDYTDAWVRDNVYSILSVWGLSLAYKKYAPKDIRAYTLRQSVVKLMRGLLRSMMLQASRVEAYKKSHDPLDALHAKYATNSGLAVVADDAWGHLQLDATSLFVLMIAQMSASGIALIYTKDEVDFVQNLVHYISKTYATPDYGIWERGNKINHGDVEINCSSVGMAKAALEAISGFNLFIESEAKEGVIHVVPNDVIHSRLTLESLLPRESDSKETDAALLSIIGYPAYAVEDTELVVKTRQTIIEKLAGNYGCKRFLLDGHQSVIEDSSRLHYEASELREFAHIESEWPLFFTYLLLDAIMRGDEEATALWRAKLEPLFVEQEGVRLLPELYYVPLESIELEKAKPKSQVRVANENLPLVWAQSLYMLSDMLLEGLLEVQDIDPLRRSKRIGTSVKTTPFIPIIAQNAEIQQQLFELGISSQRLEELEPVVCMHASELAKVHTFLGKNEKLGLSGREILTPRTVSTSRLHILGETKVLFFPYYFDPKSFYFGYDNKLFVEHFRSSVGFLANMWGFEKRPIIPFYVREDMLRDDSKDVILKLLYEIRDNRCTRASVDFTPLAEIIESVETEKMHNASLENLDIISSEQVENTQEYERAALCHDWREVRLIAQKNALCDIRIEDALMDILVAQKRLSVGRSYSDDSIIDTPKEASEIMEMIEKFSGENSAEKALTQEVILHLGHLMRIEPVLFENMLTLRTWDAIQLLVGHVSKEKSLSIADAYEDLLTYAPHGIYDTLRFIYSAYSREMQALKELENLHVTGVESLELRAPQFESTESFDVQDWERWREKAGRLGALSEHFYQNVWHILQQCKGLVIGDKYSIQSRMGSELTLESTAGERSFELKIDSLLQSINIPAYRKLNIELIETLAKLFGANPELRIEDDLILDVLIGHAVRISWMKDNEGTSYDEHKGEAWGAFYKYSPLEVQESFIAAFGFLMHEESVA